MLLGFAVALAIGRLPEPAREALLRWWARGLLAALGVRMNLVGDPIRAPSLIVANHVSWLDVIALAAVDPAVFVCKSEIAGWPGIGWLLRRVDTIFIRRGSFRDVWRVNIEVRARLDSGKSVAAFPEGTTTHGDDVLAFRPALFQPAVERSRPVCPVAIAYSSAAAAYVGDTSFLRSLLAIAGARNLDVHLAMLPPLATCGIARREAADHARRAIREALARVALNRNIAAVLQLA